ncbi:MAG TPA: hypothetical protein VFX39_01525, partial [Gemmatimonadaceae bacterium]|nr:hypothetical protein [Gemmatimonadaceae bacterium]
RTDAEAAPADDSIRVAAALDSALAEFREGLPVVTALAGGEADRDALVRRFVRAVEARDADDLRAMVMDRAEFAYLYYPTSPYTRRPTRQEAPLAWFIQLENSQKGASRVLGRYGGRALHAAGYQCDAEPVASGENRLWSNCVLRLAPPGQDTTEIRLFGGIIEREGRYKLFSYTNDL